VDSPLLYLYPETSLEPVLAQFSSFSPQVATVDSIQSVNSEELESPPGSFSQLRTVVDGLVSAAKTGGFALFLIGHVTKEGAIAGPKLIEHMVDTVLYLEGDSSSPYRILRAVKNRFGSTNEIGVFEMTESSLAEVKNPSAAFLSERPLGAPGSAVTASLEGTRPLLVEIQALTSPTPFGMPRRNVTGLDPNRLNLLIAVLDKRGGLALSGQDIFTNAAGGIRVTEPASDLALAAALASSYSGIPVDPDTIFFGEIGLAGEIRGVTQPEIRIQESRRLGFKGCFLPLSNQNRLQYNDKNFQVTGVKNISDFLTVLFPGKGKQR
jgi:DNA repair protein RadA/Sms